jgi:hypothetical protein
VTKAPARPRALQLHLREIDDNLAFTASTVTAWYVLKPLHWPMRTGAVREGLIMAAANGWAGLAGRQLHLRVTSSPYRIAQWAEQLYRRTPNPMPAPEGHTWSEELRVVQRHMQDTTMPPKMVFLGVEIATRPILGRLSERRLTRVSDAELDRARTKAAKVNRLMAAPGLAGRPATADEMEWLLHRSVGLYLDPPPHVGAVRNGQWEATDFGEVSDRVVLRGTPTGKTVEVTDRNKGVKRHVTVLTYSRMEDIPIPGADAPWMTTTDQLGMVLERSARLKVVSGKVIRDRMSKNMERIGDQQEQYDEHGMRQPPELAIKERRTDEIRLETTEGTAGEATRITGQHRIAVYGTTEEECLERVATVQELYESRRMVLVAPMGQLALVREFIPGAPPAVRTDRAYRRNLPAVYFAAGMPQATSAIGDGRGPFLGHTASGTPVHFDTHDSTERSGRSGLNVIVGRQGAGKTVLLAHTIYNAARRGIRTTVLDPSGPLARLATMPELRGRSRHVDLLSAPPGTLSPYAVVPDPPGWETFLDDPDLDEIHDPAQRREQAYRLWQNAVHQATAERQDLAEDIIRLLLPVKVIENPATEIVLPRAILDVGGASTASLWHVVHHLRGQDSEHAKILGDLLARNAEGLHGRLFFAPEDQPVAMAGEVGFDPTLLVITMPGIQLPNPRTPQSSWTAAQRVGVPLLYLANWWTTARIYRGDRNERKCLALDERGQAANWPGGQALFDRVTRDTRKYNACVVIASQDPDDILGMNISNHLSTAWVGHIEQAEHVDKALELLRLPGGAGFEHVISSLAVVDPDDEEAKWQPRPFVMKDASGQLDVVTIDLEYHPRLLEILDTNADSTKVRVAAAAGVPA